MTEEDKLLVELFKKIYKVYSLPEIATMLGYAESTANNWYSNGLNDRVRQKMKHKLMEHPEVEKNFENSPIKLDLFAKTEKSLMRKIPYYDCFKASAGFGALNGDVKEPEYIILPSRFLNGASSSTEAIKCQGDSMSPSLNDGDVMFIDRCDTDIKEGEVYVVRCVDELYVKRLFKMPGIVIARSDNKTYPEFPLKLNECEILGRVVYKMERV